MKVRQAEKYVIDADNQTDAVAEAIDKFLEEHPDVDPSTITATAKRAPDPD